MHCCHSPHVTFPPIFGKFIAYLLCTHQQSGQVHQVTPEGGTPDAVCARRGDLATSPVQATVVTTKGFSLRRGSFSRAKSLGQSGKTSHKTSAQRAQHKYSPQVWGHNPASSPGVGCGKGLAKVVQWFGLVCRML